MGTSTNADQTFSSPVMKKQVVRNLNCDYFDLICGVLFEIYRKTFESMGIADVLCRRSRE